MNYKTNGICQVWECPQENQIRLIFNDKPSESTRLVLRKNGFYWSPETELWQRQFNSYGRYATRKVLEMLSKRI